MYGISFPNKSCRKIQMAPWPYEIQIPPWPELKKFFSSSEGTLGAWRGRCHHFVRRFRKVMEKYGKMPYVFRKNLARFREDYRKTFKGRFREIDWAGKQAERLG